MLVSKIRGFFFKYTLPKYPSDNPILSYAQYGDVNSLYRGVMSQKLLVSNFECMQDTSEFNVDFMKNCNEESSEGYFIEGYIQTLKNYLNFIMICHFYHKG